MSSPDLFFKNPNTGEFRPFGEVMVKFLDDDFQRLFFQKPSIRGKIRPWIGFEMVKPGIVTLEKAFLEVYLPINEAIRKGKQTWHPCFTSALYAARYGSDFNSDVQSGHIGLAFSRMRELVGEMKELRRGGKVAYLELFRQYPSEYRPTLNVGGWVFPLPDFINERYESPYPPLR